MDAHGALVRKQFGVAAAAIVGVLMDIDDRLGRLPHVRSRQRRRHGGQETTSRYHARQNISLGSRSGRKFREMFA